MRRHRNAILICVALVLAAVLGACSAESNIIGIWEFETVKGSWRYNTMKFSNPFFIDAYHGSYMNLQSFHGLWSMPSPNRLEVTWTYVGNANLTPPTSYEVKITGNRLEIADEYGNRAVGTRVSDAYSSGARWSRGSASVLLWTLFILLAAVAVSIYVIRRRGKRQGTTSAAAASAGRPVQQAFCMHCGQPIQAGSKFCQHCGKPLL